MRLYGKKKKIIIKSRPVSEKQEHVFNPYRTIIIIFFFNDKSPDVLLNLILSKLRAVV